MYICTTTIAIHLTGPPQALVRDNYRCMVTATVDYRSYTVLPDLHRICVQKSLATATTHCCHIFPQSTNDFPNGAGADEGSKVCLSFYYILHNSIKFDTEDLSRHGLDYTVPIWFPKTSRSAYRAPNSSSRQYIDTPCSASRDDGHFATLV